MKHDYRVAFFTKHKRKTLYTTYVIRALRRIGCEVRRVNMAAVRRYVGRSLADKIVRRYVDSFKPDAVVIFSGDIQDETFEHFHGRVRTGLLLDDYFPTDAPVTRFIKRVDVFFHTMTGQLEEYRAAGARHPVYLHSGVDPDSHRRSAPRKAFSSDVAFIGAAVYPDRIDLIKTLHREFDIKIYGSGWRKLGIRPARDRIGVKQFSRVCASARIMVGIDKAADRELYFSNRTWFVLGCGGFLITRYVPGLESIFANHKHLVWYRDTEEALDQIRFYLRENGLRRKIADTGHEYVHTHYPFDRMASNMVEVLFRDREPRPLTDPGPGLERGAIDTTMVERRRPDVVVKRGSG
jgi:spore maturation protein CgeB